MLHPFINRTPDIHPTAYVAPSADVIGDVVLGESCSVWFNTTIRGDVHRIRIGARTNVQDNAVIHVTHGTAPTTIGEEVTIAHGAIVHGCTIHDRVLIGMGAVVMDHATIGTGSLVGARALVTGGTEIPPRSLVLGSPARVVRELTDEEVADVASFAANYVRYSEIYRGEEVPEENPYY